MGNALHKSCIMFIDIVWSNDDYIFMMIGVFPMLFFYLVIDWLVYVYQQYFGHLMNMYLCVVLYSLSTKDWKTEHVHTNAPLFTFVTSEIFNGFWFLNYMLMFVLFCIFGMNIPKTLWKHNWYIYYSLYSREWFHSIPFFSEKDFNVQTCIIALDFNSGRDVYPTIWEKIKDKEIGILGKNVFRALLKHILCIDLLKRRRTVLPLLACQLIDPSLSTPKMILIKKN